MEEIIIKSIEKKNKDLERLNKRWQLVFTKMQGLVNEFGMLKAIHNEIVTNYYKD